VKQNDRGQSAQPASHTCIHLLTDSLVIMIDNAPSASELKSRPYGAVLCKLDYYFFV